MTDAEDYLQFGALCLGEKFLVRILGGALQRRVSFVGPDSLQIGFAPGRFQRGGCPCHR